VSASVSIHDTTAPVRGWHDLLRVDDPAERNEWCRDYLERLRWPDGVTCPRCGSARITRVRSRRQIDCRECRYRFSVTSGTRFHDSAVPLWKWVAAVSLLVESRDGFPAHRLSGTIGVSYKTAWSLGHRIRAALAGDGEPANVNGGGRVEAGSYHQVSPKYAAAYLAEREWRARHRTDPDALAGALRALLRPTGRHANMTA
jgi:transposase-like protein